MNQASGQAGGKECVRLSAVFMNLTLYEYSLLEKSLGAFAISRGHYEESP